ncbi:unnamed protein product [Laminaria digitata]
MQPQGHVQLLMNLLVRGMDVQAAIDAPRFCIRDGTVDGIISLEPWQSYTYDNTDTHDNSDNGDEGGQAVARELRRMGHNIVVVRGHNRFDMGRAQVRKHWRVVVD